jgi:Radical SAM superfamily
VISLAKQSFVVPDRRGLPALGDYASVAIGDERRVSGYTEASRGCKHMCRHCPVVPVYGGRFRIVASDVVLADIDQQVRGGARHVTFGDPDFFNGPTHAMRVLEGLHAAHPQLTYDVTIKVEHLLRHAALLPDLRRTGCLFVTSAVESIDDRVLTLLDKHHTRGDFIDVVRLFDSVGLTLNPTFVTFHPWLTVRGYRELLALIDELDLVDHVASVQLAIRLLIPAGSRLLELDEIASLVDGFEQEGLSYTWSHPDGRVDAMFEEVRDVVESGVTDGIERREIFDDVWRVAREADEERDEIKRRPDFGRRREPVPHMTEPWFCCSEPLQRPTVADPAGTL